MFCSRLKTPLFSHNQFCLSQMRQRCQNHRIEWVVGVGKGRANRIKTTLKFTLSPSRTQSIRCPRHDNRRKQRCRDDGQQQAKTQRSKGDDVFHARILLNLGKQNTRCRRWNFAEKICVSSMVRISISARLSAFRPRILSDLVGSGEASVGVSRGCLAVVRNRGTRI